MNCKQFNSISLEEVLLSLGHLPTKQNEREAWYLNPFASESLAEYVDARFETVSSKRDVSAFILYIGDYMLIEFSNEGYAFYTYKINSPYKPSLSYQLNSVDDLRNASMPMAIQSDNYYDYFNDEGRLTHRDGNQIWETRFNSWMNKKVFG